MNWRIEKKVVTENLTVQILRCVLPSQCAPTGVSLSKHTSYPTCNYQQEVDVIAFFHSWQFQRNLLT